RHLVFDEIFVGHTCFDIRAPWWTFEYLRKQFPPQRKDMKLPGGKGGRYYISRRQAKSRRVSNEKEIVPELQKRGFEVLELERMKFEDQKAAFENASVIVSVGGAAFANMVFCKPDCRVLQLLNGDLQQHEDR